MGCCGAVNSVKECNTIDEVINFIKSLQQKADIEQTEITNYLNDKSKIPKTVNINEHNDDTLTQRSNYLTKYKNALETAVGILSQNKLIDLGQTKNQIEALNQVYYVREDTNKVLEQVIDNLNILLEYANNGYVNNK
jgi:hypothetical protein